MGDMRKVRVSLTDAEGKVHEVVGYRRNAEITGVFMRDDDEATGINASVMVQWVDDEDVTVTPIQELPTGLGAVVEVDYGPPINEVERFVHIGDDYWHEARSCRELTSSMLGRMAFTILSEGVK